MTEEGYNRLSGNSGNFCDDPRVGYIRACYCRKQHYGEFCDKTVPIDCVSNMVNPQFSDPEMCEMKKGTSNPSSYYNYNISGFDPCFEVDLTKDSFNMEYTLECKSKELI